MPELAEQDPGLRPSAREQVLLAQVQSLAQTIAGARAEIQKLAVDDIAGNHIPTATDELDAIVEHTAAATDTILEACETVDAACAALDEEWSAKLQAATTQIYEACSFQDITGQRIRKVVGALKAIDAKVGAMLAQFGPEDALAAIDLQPLSRARGLALPPGKPEAGLLNGPQLPGSAMGQSDIDKLLASFG